ncbi:nuclear transport factor 2 family protein [Sphingomonas sp. OK281]|uniref:nuclear transport factor 2 family protein n=1 Tax=Sphingomonas sp. OK281 TaxID=1881067 RepID=UPI0008E1ADD7|nr:nuclear transport factor 2 family protein [Sphingomonas sp. OK281]SFO01878.1 hypothetical protein SAMN05428984_1650 [Sphingomonas sp. OK281]
MPMTDREIVRGAFDAWSAGTGNPFELFAEQATITVVGNSVVSKTYSGRDAFLTGVIIPFHARMHTPPKPVIKGLYQDGEMVIVLFEINGVARDDQPYHNTYSWFLKMRNGKIVEGTTAFDSVAFNALWTRVPPE